MRPRLTADIKPEWDDTARAILNIVRRLQSEAKTDGCAVLTIRVAVNSKGNPICWTSPDVVRLEPKASCNIDELLAALTK